MQLTGAQQKMLAGEAGRAVQKSMQILTTLGAIYGAERLIPVSSVQVAGVSYANLGEAGLEFLAEMVDGGGRTRVLTTLNPAGMDIENREGLGIDAEFARNQARVLEAFARMGVLTTCTCTPYLSGNLPHYGQHLAWAESSAVCFANSVIGACTNREGGPSALAAALTGLTPEYGYHLEERRQPDLTFEVQGELAGTHEFGALGRVIGERLERMGLRAVPYIRGVAQAEMEELKSLCASIATYGGVALFHMQGITPESMRIDPPEQVGTISMDEIEAAVQAMSDAGGQEVDFVSLGCPHLSIHEVARAAQLLEGKKVRKEFWITTARPTKQMADRMGYTQIIEASGARIAADTCPVVAPIKGRFQVMATDSAKGCYYASAKHGFKTVYRSFEEVIVEALR